jgi:hypothetical protein
MAEVKVCSTRARVSILVSFEYERLAGGSLVYCRQSMNISCDIL